MPELNEYFCDVANRSLRMVSMVQCSLTRRYPYECANNVLLVFKVHLRWAAALTPPEGPT